MYIYNQAEAAIVDLDTGKYISKDIYLLRGEKESGWKLDSPFFYRNKYLVGFSSRKVNLFFLNHGDIDLIELPSVPVTDIYAVAFANGHLYVGGSSQEVDESTPIPETIDIESIDEEDNATAYRYLGPSLCRIKLDDLAASWDYLILGTGSSSSFGKAVDCFAVSFDEKKIVAIDNNVQPNIDFLLLTDVALKDATIAREVRYLYSNNHSIFARYTGSSQYALLANGNSSGGTVQGISTFSFQDQSEAGHEIKGFNVQENSCEPFYSSDDLKWCQFDATENWLYIITRSKKLLGIYKIGSESLLTYAPLATIMSNGCRVESTKEDISEDLKQSYTNTPQPKISAEQEAALNKLKVVLSEEIDKGLYYNYATERRKILGEIVTYSTFGEEGVNIRHESFNSFPLNRVNDEQILFHPRKTSYEKLRLVYACSSGVYVDDLW